MWHKLRRDELPPHIKLTLGRRESRRRLLPTQIERVNFLRNSSADNLRSFQVQMLPPLLLVYRARCLGWRKRKIFDSRVLLFASFFLSLSFVRSSSPSVPLWRRRESRYSNFVVCFSAFRRESSSRLVGNDETEPRDDERRHLNNDYPFATTAN